MTCTIEGCDRATLANGLCSMHYQRQRRRGSTEEVARGIDPAKRLAAGRVVDAVGCHIWTKSLNGRGYGIMYFDGRLQLAHRVAWQLAGRDLPAKGDVLDHICEVKACVNAEHLRVLSNRENIMRSPLSPMRLVAESPTCRNGHEYPDPPIRDRNGWRVCAVCALLRSERSGS